MSKRTAPTRARLALPTFVLAAAASLAPFSGAVRAQDMIGFNYVGNVYAIDSRSGAVRLIRSNPASFYQAAARMPDGRVVAALRCWKTYKGRRYLGAQIHEIDERTGAKVQSLVGDTNYTAMAPKNNNEVWCVYANGLAYKSLSPTFIRYVGGRLPGNVESLANSAKGLFGYSSTIGLFRMDTTTGAVTDVNPNIGATAAIRFLTFRSDGRLFGGANELYELDTNTGAARQIASLGAIDLTGAEFLSTGAWSFGTACRASGGTPKLQVTGTPALGQTIYAQSGTHAASSYGLTVLGFSDQSWGSLALPLALDPILGTSGCSLYVSGDVFLAGQCDANGNLTTSLRIPFKASGAFFHLQQLVLEAVQGGLSASDAVTIRVR